MKVAPLFLSCVLLVSCSPEIGPVHLTIQGLGSAVDIRTAGPEGPIQVLIPVGPTTNRLQGAQISLRLILNEGISTSVSIQGESGRYDLDVVGARELAAGGSEAVPRNATVTLNGRAIDMVAAWTAIARSDPRFTIEKK